jgi:hypothetical protein
MGAAIIVDHIEQMPGLRRLGQRGGRRRGLLGNAMLATITKIAEKRAGRGNS